MITLDTSGLFALLNRSDRDHRAARDALLSDGGPYLVPVGILGEISYLVEERLGTPVLEAMLSDLEAGGLRAECGENDLARIRQLVVRYADLPLGFAEACVIACAERNGGAVLTLDRRDFDVVAADVPLALLP